MDRGSDSSTTRGGTRRAVLGALLTAGLGVAVYGILGRSTLPPRHGDGLPTPSDVLRQGLDALVPDGPGRAAVASAATEALGQHGSRWRDTPSALAGIEHATFDEALDAVRRAVRADYAAGRTVPVRDWVIARTEAELLAALG